jgi:hypothetical protein
MFGTSGFFIYVHGVCSYTGVSTYSFSFVVGAIVSMSYPSLCYATEITLRFNRLQFLVFPDII